MSYYRIYEYPYNDKTYKHLLLYGFRGGPDKKEPPEKKESPERLPESLSRSRRLVRDYILCNKFDYFCTFTFDKSKIDRYDYKECASKLTKFFNNFRNRKSPDFRYVVIPEFHKDGAIHFHGVVSGIPDDEFEVPDKVPKLVKVREGKELKEVLELVPNTRGYVRWKSYRLGFFSCSAIRKYSASAAYVSKYITKDLLAIPVGQKIVLHSAKLHKPELILDVDDVPWTLDGCDYAGEYCKFKFTDSTLELVPDWYGECCSDLRDSEQEEGDLTYDEIFEPLTGEQLHLWKKPQAVG